MRWPSLMEIDTDRFRHTSDEAANADAEALERLVADGAFKGAVAAFSAGFRSRPFDVLPDRDYAPFARYCAAIAVARAGNIADARGYMAQVDIPFSGDFDLLPYEAAVAFGHEMRRRQLECIAAGKPGIAVAALPKSASGFLSNTLAAVLDVPIARSGMVCRGPGPVLDYFVLEAWAGCIAQGGCVTHDHIGAGHGNAALLEKAGIRKLVVQLRDPRASTLSLYHHFFGDNADTASGRTFHKFAGEYYRHLAGWIDGWLRYAAEGGGRMEIRFVRYEDIRTNAAATIAAVTQFATGLDKRHDVENYLAERQANGVLPNNFRSGDPEGWRSAADTDLTQWFWRNTPERVRSYLEMVE